MISDQVHKIVKGLNLEEVFVNASSHIPIFRKFVPLPSDYSKDDHILIERNSIKFGLNRSDYMQWRVYADFSEPIYEFINDRLEGAGLIIDVGANIGAFSFNLARLLHIRGVNESSIHAFEPNPAIITSFKENQNLNPILKSLINIHNLACGNENRVVKLAFNTSNTGGGRISDKIGIPVNMVRLDDFLSDHLDEVKILKIDVEGFEPEVLKGARELINRSNPLIYLEVTDRWYKDYGSSVIEVIDSFHKERYQLFYEQGDKFLELKDIPDKFQFNLVCIPD